MPILIKQLSSNKPICLVSVYFRLKSFLNTIKPDILHGHCSAPLYLMSFLPYKTVYTIHIYPGIQNIAISGKIRGNIIIKLDNFFTKWCDMPICCSKSISDMYLSERNIDYKAIPNGTSYKIWEYDENRKIQLKKELGLDLKKKYFIFVGRFSKEKRPDILIEVFRRRYDLGLVMLGDGPLWENLNNIKTDNIIMPGFTERVSDYLKASDFYISTSEIEGLANTLLESMSIGLPFILSNIPSHNEVKEKFHSNIPVGYLIDNNSVTDIMDKIDKIQTISICDARTNIQNIFRQYYTAEVMARKYEEVYSILVSKS